MVYKWFFSARRPRWLYSDKDRVSTASYRLLLTSRQSLFFQREQEKMEKQHKMEKERMRKRRNSHDLEKIELTQTGRLLVNAGWFQVFGIASLRAITERLIPFRTFT